MNKKLLLFVLVFSLLISSAVSAQQYGGELRIACLASNEPQSMDYHFDPYSNTANYDSFCADPLVTLDPDGNYVGVLAESWEISEDGLEWIFKIKEGINFQDGTPVNADAVKRNFERVKDPNNASVMLSSELGEITGYEIVDDYTLKVKYDVPNASLITYVRSMPIWSPTSFDQYTTAEFEEHLVGAGPFKFVEHVPSDHVTFERWDDYGDWNPVKKYSGPVYLDKITIYFVGEALVLASSVMNGEADLAESISANQIDMYDDGSVGYVHKGSQAATGWSLVFNTRRAPMNQKAVRQALLIATDQDEINDILFAGNYLPTYGPINSPHPCYNPEVENVYPVDLDKAAALLDEAGWVMGDKGIRVAKGVEGVEDGTPLHMVYTALNDTTGSIGEVLQLQWGPLGVDLEIEVVAGTIQIEKATSHDFDILFQSVKSPEPAILDQVFNSKNDFEGGWSWSGLKNDAIDAKLNEMMSITDYDTRCEIAKEVQLMILEEAPQLPTVSTQLFYALSNKVHDFETSSEAGHYFLLNTWIEQ